MKRRAEASRLLWALVFFSAVVVAGPPFLTDDPEPTELGHWEIYLPQLEWSGRGQDFEGSFGTELNYGAEENLQLTLGLPVAFSHDAAGWGTGVDDIRLSVKYRIYQNTESGVQIAVFPGVTLPTGGNGFGAGNPTGFLPVWMQKESGPWVIFGGGGYAINPGTGNRNYWIGAGNVARRFSDRWLVGFEAQIQGADTLAGQRSTSLGIGAICRLTESLRLLGRAGPTFAGAGGPPTFHAFLAIGLDF
jgi:hypothetical protein